jgi:hypothetical protein
MFPDAPPDRRTGDHRTDERPDGRPADEDRERIVIPRPK